MPSRNLTFDDLLTALADAGGLLLFLAGVSAASVVLWAAL